MANRELDAELLAALQAKDAARVKALLDAGADPNAKEPKLGLPALFVVTGHHHAPEIARMLLEAGADPNDGESVFHAAESFHEEALELLLRFGADLNWTGDWGNTPLYFLLRYWDLEREERAERGLRWLLDHGADPNVRCGRERETSLHVAVRRGQGREVVRRLLEHGADVGARRGDGRTPWVLAERGGFEELKALLEAAGARPEPLSPEDELLAACSRGDEAEARRRSTPEVLAALASADLELIIEAARQGRAEVVRACLAAGLPVDTRDENAATALHHAAINGQAPVVRELLRSGPDLTLRDTEHHATPLDWATFGVDHVAHPNGDYEACARALLEAGARPTEGHYLPKHEGVRAALGEYGVK
jgi:ankyrin repeat protein